MCHPYFGGIAWDTSYVMRIFTTTGHTFRVPPPWYVITQWSCHHEPLNHHHLHLHETPIPVRHHQSPTEQLLTVFYQIVSFITLAFSITTTATITRHIIIIICHHSQSANFQFVWYAISEMTHDHKMGMMVGSVRTGEWAFYVVSGISVVIWTRMLLPRMYPLLVKLDNHIYPHTISNEKWW